MICLLAQLVSLLDYLFLGRIAQLTSLWSNHALAGEVVRERVIRDRVIREGYY